MEHFAAEFFIKIFSANLQRLNFAAGLFVSIIPYHHVIYNCLSKVV